MLYFSNSGMSHELMTATVGAMAVQSRPELVCSPGGTLGAQGVVER